MNIQRTAYSPLKPQISAKSQPAPEQPSAPPQESKDSYSAWTPLANAGVVGAAVAVPTALGAIGNSLFPNASPLVQGGLAVGTAVLMGAGAATWAVRGAKEEFNGHPILTGISGLVIGGGAALAGGLLSPIGISGGWTAAAIATGVAAVGAGVITAVGISQSRPPSTPA